MPQIVEYVNREGITPTDRGTEAKVQEGRRIGASFNQVAESMRDFGNRTAQELGGAIKDAGDAAVQYAEHREIGQGVSTYAQLQDTLINQWNDVAKNADPNDPSVRQKFIEGTLTPALQNWGDSFNTEGGQKWAQQRTSALLDHMYEKTAADMGTLAGQAIQNNVRTLGNVQSNTAYNDPSSVDHLLKQTDESIGALVDSSPNLKGAAAGAAKTNIAEKQKEQIVKAGAVGAIAKSNDPEKTAEEWARKYPQYITGEEAKILAGNARTQIRAGRVDDAYARTLQKQDAQDRSDQAEDTILQNLYSDDPKKQSKVTAKSIVNSPDLVPEKKKMLVQLLEREQKPETNNRISATTTTNLLRQLRDPNANLDQLMNATWDARLKDPGQPGSLTERDFNTVRNEIIGRKTPEGEDLSRNRDNFFKKYAPVIDGAMVLGDHSPAGAQQMYFAQMDAMKQEKVLRSKGIDPQELYDPRSQYFFGRPENIGKYHVSLDESMKDKAATLKSKGQPQVLTPAPFEPVGSKPAAASFSDRFNAATGVNPTRVRQGGHTFERQPDGSMKQVD